MSTPASRRLVRTVLGDIEPGELGPCDAHEHLFLDTPLQPGEEFLDEERAIAEARALYELGGRSLVDWTPLGLGRKLEGLVAVAIATGLKIVAATGLHRDAHYTEDDPVRSLPAHRLAQTFAEEILSAEIPCGVIKAGASYHRVTAFEYTVFEAAAEAHARTGAPVCVHAEHGTNGLGLVELLAALGVRSSSVILAHLDRNPDAGEHAETAATGAWLQFDGPGRTKYWPDSTIMRLIADLAERGLDRQMLLGGDTGRRSMMRAYGGGPGLDYLFRRFKPRLERELGGALSARIFVDNPARAFSFEARTPSTP